MSKEEKFMKTVIWKAELWSKDPSTKVCALIIDPNGWQELSSGYNGIPRGVLEPPERWERPTKYMWVEHAERNAIYNASCRGCPLAGSWIIVNKFPCHECARGIIQCGIKKIVAPKPDLTNETWKESWKIALQMFSESNTVVVECDLM